MAFCQARSNEFIKIWKRLFFDLVVGVDIQVLLGVLKNTFQSNNIDKVKLMVVLKNWILTKDIYLRSTLIVRMISKI